MIDILNLTYPEVEALLVSLGEKSARARQVWKWLWNKHVRDFDQMTDVSSRTRTLLKERAEIVWPAIETVQTSADGTIKFLLKLRDGALVETVLIPGAGERLSQCLSCQVGCAMGCTFCATGTMGLTRNMTMSEILGQILVARNHLDDIAEKPRVRNLVFMGMGEPLMNLGEVLRSLQTLNHETGLLFSPRRITVSTCGIRSGLRELGESGLAYLAVSLHAPNQQLRAQIMPKAAQWELEELITALQHYPLAAREHMTFEYLLLGGVNDSTAHARELAELMHRTRGKLNIIVYNPAGETDDPYRAPDEQQVQKFMACLKEHKVTAIRRQSRGMDIKAACGQLKAAQQKAKAGITP